MIDFQIINKATVCFITSEVSRIPNHMIYDPLHYEYGLPILHAVCLKLSLVSNVHNVVINHALLTFCMFSGFATNSSYKHLSVTKQDTWLKY